MTDIRERIARQLELEGESRQLGAERYRSQRPLPWREAASAVEEEANLPPGRQLLKLAVEPTSRALIEFLDRITTGGAGRRPAAFKVLSRVDPQEASYIACRVIVNSAAVGQTVQATAFAVAEALVHHVEMMNLSRANKKGYTGLLKSQEKAGFSSKKRAAIAKIMDAEGTMAALCERLEARLSGSFWSSGRTIPAAWGTTSCRPRRTSGRTPAPYRSPATTRRVQSSAASCTPSAIASRSPTFAGRTARRSLADDYNSGPSGWRSRTPPPSRPPSGPTAPERAWR